MEQLSAAEGRVPEGQGSGDAGFAAGPEARRSTRAARGSVVALRLAVEGGSSGIRAKPGTQSRISDGQSLVCRVRDDYGTSCRSDPEDEKKPGARPAMADYQRGHRMGFLHGAAI